MRIFLIHFLFFLMAPSATAYQKKSDTLLDLEDLLMKKMKIMYLDINDSLFKDGGRKYWLGQTADTIQYDYWKKLDLNHDGKIDYLFSGSIVRDKNSKLRSTISVAIAQNGRFKPIDLEYDFFYRYSSQTFLYPKVIKVNSLDYLELTYFEPVACRSQEYAMKKDTIYVKNGSIIPYMKQKLLKSLASINFRTSTCYGTCPVFELQINSDRSAFYIGGENSRRKGRVELRATRDDIDYLSQLISSINLDSLEKKYRVCWTDDQTGYLIITLNDGSKYEIQDYGMKGTYRLNLLQNYLYDLADF